MDTLKERLERIQTHCETWRDRMYSTPTNALTEPLAGGLGAAFDILDSLAQIVKERNPEP